MNSVFICPACGGRLIVHRAATRATSSQAQAALTVWESVDWSKSNHEIAEALGMNPGYVSTRRRMHSPQTLARRVRWDDVDWGIKDADIARSLGVSRQAVGQQRVRIAAQALGRLGGQAGTGEAKRRSTSFSSASAKAALKSRWERAKTKARALRQNAPAHRPAREKE